MLCERAAAAPDVPMALLCVCAAHTRADTLYLDEIVASARDEPGFGLVLALSREGGWWRPDGAAMTTAPALLPAPPVRAFVCGSAGFVEAMTALRVEAGISRRAVRTERFG